MPAHHKEAGAASWVIAPRRVVVALLPLAVLVLLVVVVLFVVVLLLASRWSATVTHAPRMWAGR